MKKSPEDVVGTYLDIVTYSVNILSPPLSCSDSINTLFANDWGTDIWILPGDDESLTLTLSSPTDIFGNIIQSDHYYCGKRIFEWY